MKHITLLVAALVLLLGPAPASAQARALISITSTPPYGSAGLVRGTVAGVRPAVHRVLLFVRVQEAWWSKPTFEARVPIAADGTWEALAIGGADHLATRFAAFVVSAGFVPTPAAGTPGIPSATVAAAVASTMVLSEPTTRSLRFSGYTWRVKDSAGLLLGPGPNVFSAAPAAVSVDAAGRLHLRLTRHGGRWASAEVWLTRPLGYGTYSFVIEDGAGAIDPDAVFGAFLWDESAEAVAFREIDFLEISRWGDPAGPGGQFVIQPHETAGHRHRFTLDPGPTTVVSTWSPGAVTFRAGSREWTFTGAAVPAPGDERVHLVLWLLGGAAPAARNTEVIVRSFTFTPMGGGAR